MSGLWWIGSAFLIDSTVFLWALPIAVIALPAVLALFWAVCIGLTGFLWSAHVRRVFLLAAMLGVAEYLRGFLASGFPWNTIGYAAFPVPIFMQSASLLGIYGATPFMVLIASAPGVIVPGMQEQEPARKRLFSLIFLLIAAHTAYGFLRMPSKPDDGVEGVSIRLVQPSIPQHEKFLPEKHPEHLQRYMELSKGHSAGQQASLKGVTHLFWPESVFPYLLTENRRTLSLIADLLPEGTSLITGAVRAESGVSNSEQNLVFNSVYVINHEGLIVSAADKVHLVPFGEYLPFQSFLESIGLRQLTQIDGGFEPGSLRKLLSTGIGPEFLPLICYEIIFSGQIWNREKRPGYIANFTNDAWFGYTPGPFQHERQSIVRGVEQGLPVIRIANTGVSGVYDAYGRSVVRLDLGEVDILDSHLPSALEPTPYAKHSFLIIWSVIISFLFVALLPVPEARIAGRNKS